MAFVFHLVGECYGRAAHVRYVQSDIFFLATEYHTHLWNKVR